MKHGRYLIGFLMILGFGITATAATIATVNGKVITDDEGLTIPDASRAGPYSNFK